MITFIKTLSYRTKPEHGDAFAYATQLLNQDINPPSNSKACIFIPPGITVFHSLLLRVRDTLPKLSATQLIPQDTLKEIKFDLPSFIEKADFEQHGSTAVREAFLKAFLTNSLDTPRNNIFADIENLLQKCSNKNNIFVISHSFRLKLIEVYIKTNKEIVTNPMLLTKYLDVHKKTYGFGEFFQYCEEDQPI